MNEAVIEFEYLNRSRLMQLKFAVFKLDIDLDPCGQRLTMVRSGQRWSTAPLSANGILPNPFNLDNPMQPHGLL